MVSASINLQQSVHGADLPDHFQIRSQLGEGSYGRVFEAWDTSLCRAIAIKQLKQGAAALDPERLIREARQAAALSHSAFVKIFSVAGVGANQAIIMELVQGNTLRQCMLDRTLNQAQALEIVDQIAAAMAEAHASGLVHGDLKPSNLIIEASGAPRILDFGLARQINPLANPSSMTDHSDGTIAYMAPERLGGQPPSVASDIYALGAMLYEMLAGTRPFADLDGLALAAAHLQSCSSRWPFPPEVPAATVALVLAMTARDPSVRLRSMAAVRQRIAALSAPDAPAATATRRRWRGWRGAAAAGAAVALLGGALWLLAPLQRWLPAMAPAQTLQAGMEALRHYDRDDSLTEATATFQAILRQNPRQASAAAGLSLAYSMRYNGDGRDPALLAQANASAQQALRLDDQLALAHVALGDTLLVVGQQEAALPHYSRALELDPRCLLALIGKINSLLTLRRFDEAETLLRQGRQMHPRERRLADLLGTLRFQQADYTAAEAAFRLSLQLDPETVYAYANLSMALLRQGRGDEALQVLQQGLQVRPNGRLYTNLGTTLFARADYAGAAQAFERAVSGAKGSPNDYLKWANLADALRWLPGREADSQQAYRRASELLAVQLERTPDNAVLASRMGWYRVRLDDAAGALKWTERALARAPASPDVQFRAALAYELGGRRPSAIAALIRASTLGYPAHLIDSEPDLIALRRDPHYQSLLLESAQ
ncbi:protein kinase [Rugamonas sp. CCM 8940]|uniref:serine/threonine-protein kinase n=1 Tax=Rugamonas sp. CCM 8940 TaxID=2765359 RepID=UPI0018F33B5A|nr:serine/threonine-protein kinase [Rugamonas sp. CCM 8940]MBJ7312084.1 protein kinase [Rugamonas sp. CCM 8940]